MIPALLHDLDCPVVGRLPPRVQQGLSLYRQGDPRIDRHIEQSRRGCSRPTAIC